MVEFTYKIYNNMNNLDQKVVVITGGSSGIGKACAFRFAKAGMRVVITGRDKAKLDDAASALSQMGAVCLPIVCDAALREDNERMVSSVIEHFGRIDILINNAGISMRALFEELDLKVIEQVMQTNFFGMVYATKYALPYVIAQKGSIVGVSSIAGYRGLPGRTGYSASKFAMNGFLEALRTELLHTGVHVLTACPGFTASNIRYVALSKDGSPQAESPRDEAQMMSAEDVAEAIYGAIEKRKNTIILTKQGKLTVFLSKWLPTHWMDRLVYNNFAKEKNSPLR